MVEQESVVPYRSTVHDWSTQTPQSAVSSFNLPLNADSTLITPVSASGKSPNLSSRALDIRSAPRSSNTLNPIHLQPQMFSPRPVSLLSHSPIKTERNAGTPDMAPFGSYFDDSSNQQPPPTPYFGHYGVSMPSTSRSPQTMLPAPTYSHSYEQGPSLVHTSPSSIHHAPILMSPDPSTLRPMKRRRTNEFAENQMHPVLPPENGSEPIRRRAKNAGRARSSHPIKIRADAEMNSQEKALIDWKEKDNLPWKTIKENYESRFGKAVQETALQMKYMRLKHRLRAWTQEDLEALEKALEYWEKQKWKIVAEKMEDLGVTPRFNPKWVAIKAREHFGDRAVSMGLDAELSNSSPSPSMIDPNSPPSTGMSMGSSLPPSTTAALHPSTYAVHQPDNQYSPRIHGNHSPIQLPSQLSSGYQQLRPTTGNPCRTPLGIMNSESGSISERSNGVPITTSDNGRGLTAKSSPVMTGGNAQTSATGSPQHIHHSYGQSGMLYDQRPPENSWAINGP